MDWKGTRVTWLGHGTFYFRAPNGKTILLDPWLQNNPACPQDLKRPPATDVMLITHGHFDHIGDAVSAAAQARPERVIGGFELCSWLASKGVENTVAMNKGGTIDLDWAKITMVHAAHSCGIQDGDAIIYGGDAAGYVIQFQDSVTVYAAGDTGVFGDMHLIGELYRPQAALLPIGDLFTMGPREAAHAARLSGVSTVIPAHFGTFPALTGTPADFRKELAAIGLEHVEVHVLKPGGTAS